MPFALLCLFLPSAAGALRPSTNPAVRVSGQVPPGALAAPLSAIQCTTPQKCVAVGSLGNGQGSIAGTTSNGGADWASTPILTSADELSAVTCSTVRTCIGVGSNFVVVPGRAGAPSTTKTQGVVIRTLDRGHSWSVTTGLPKGVGRIMGVSCPTASFCMAVGESPGGGAGAALASTSSGQRWRSVPLPRGQLGLDLVTCTTRHTCLAEGSKQAVTGQPSSGERMNIIKTVDGGSTWTQSSPPKWNYKVLGFPNFMGMACPSRNRCLMAGDETPGDGTPSGEIATSVNGGGSWTLATLPPGTTALNAISCPTTANCVVVGGGIGPRGETLLDILTSSDGGNTWISRQVPTLVLGLDGVSCATAQACVAVGFGPPGAGGEKPVVAVTTNGGATWSALQ
jgi:hypothetical protein